MSKDQNESMLTSLANAQTPRRAFLRNTGLAALAAAGAMTIGGAGAAAAQTKEAGVSLDSAAPSIPEGARISLRLLRSLTLYNMGFVQPTSADRAAVQASALVQIKQQSEELAAASNGASSSYTPNPDDTSDPIPWWWWLHRYRPELEIAQHVRWEQVPIDAQVTIDIGRSLSLYNAAFQLGSLDQRLKTQTLALRNLRAQVGKLAGIGGGGSVAWDDGDGICPDWWPFPWPPRRRFVTEQVTINPALEIATDMVDSIITFNIGGAFGDGSVRVETQRVALDQLNQQFGKLGASGMTTKALIIPGDDFCGTPWPWPFPGGDPRRVVEVINPDIWGAKGAASKTTLGIFRALTLYATAAVFQDIRQGEAMQQLALGQVNKGLQTLAKQIG